LNGLARLNGMRPWQQESHYIQALILNSLAEQPVVFKGGTYLWFFHGLQRFSEDLDFTATGALSNDLSAHVSNDLALFGVENNIKNIEGSNAATSFRVAAKGPLNTGEKDICYVYVEISKREKVIMKSLSVKLDIPAYQIPIKVIPGMALDEVAAEKVRAIMSRNKARDVYDLYYLIKEKGIKFNPDLTNKKLAYLGKSFSREEFIEELNRKEDIFERELKGILFVKPPDFNEAKHIIEDWVGR
jgi:Uncharacterized conserved protein